MCVLCVRFVRVWFTLVTKTHKHTTSLGVRFQGVTQGLEPRHTHLKRLQILHNVVVFTAFNDYKGFTHAVLVKPTSNKRFVTRQQRRDPAGQAPQCTASVVQAHTQHTR